MQLFSQLLFSWFVAIFSFWSQGLLHTHFYLFIRFHQWLVLFNPFTYMYQVCNVSLARIAPLSFKGWTAQLVVVLPFSPLYWLKMNKMFLSSYMPIAVPSFYWSNIISSLKGKEKARNLFSYLFFNKIILKLSQFITIM